MLIQEVFEKSRVGETELFALDINIAIQLLSSFDGKIIYPKEKKKREIFEEVTEKIKSKSIQNGIYSCLIGKYKAEVKIADNCWTLLKNSVINTDPKPKLKGKLLPVLSSVKCDDKGTVMEDCLLGEITPSFAGNLVCGNYCNGWLTWKDANGRTIDCFRNSLPRVI